jgi:beta-galactosidase
MVCLEPITKGESYAAVAEVKPLVESVVGEYPPYAFFSVNYVSSELPGEGPASNVLDGNPDTYWHTMKGVTMASFPHDIRINLGGERHLRGLLYRGAPSPQGRVKDYEVYVSQDGKNWGEPVARGTMANTADKQEALFFTSASGKFIRFVALSSHDGGDSAAVAELNILTD